MLAIESTKQFSRDWRKVKEADLVARFSKAIRAVAENWTDGGYAGDVVPLVGKVGFYRLRVGDWRILFYVERSAESPTDGRLILIRLIPRGELEQVAKRL